MDVHGKDALGYTYDGVGNPMLSNRYRSRLDRVWYKCADYVPQAVEVVGTKAIGDIKALKTSRFKPLLPSDHYGVLCRFVPRVRH